MFAWQFAKMQAAARAHGWTPFAMMQNHYNLLYREEEREMIPLCLDQGVGLIPWSPLARGRLARPLAADTTRARTDAYARHIYGTELSAADQAVHGALHQLAQARGLPAAQVALAWVLHRPGVVAPIVGASQPRHLEDAVAALAVKLTPDEMKALEAPYAPHPISGHQ
jgi:aryl-alcohol dehydrogenase-like predicted oxidoreductase